MRFWICSTSFAKPRPSDSAPYFGLCLGHCLGRIFPDQSLGWPSRWPWLCCVTVALACGGAVFRLAIQLKVVSSGRAGVSGLSALWPGLGDCVMWNRIVVSDQNRGVYGALVHEHLRQRRALFYERLGWDIPHSEHIEQDQYDRAETIYILIERGGQVEGYARLLPTSARVSFGAMDYSYMIRDATLGLLPGIPSGILGSRRAPSASTIWEVSRLEASGKAALTALFLTIAEFLEEASAVELLAFTRKSFATIVRGIGFEAALVGAPVDYGGKPYCAISMTWGAAERPDSSDSSDSSGGPDSSPSQAEPLRLAG